MKNTLLNGMQRVVNYTHTENGAVTHKSTLNPVLDFYNHAGARRGMDNTQLFADAYGYDPILALKAAFYLRDIRGGSNIGERETFRQILRYLYQYDRDMFNAIARFVPEYGRWDDILEFVDSDVIAQLVDDQLFADFNSESTVSLLAKWMPSVETSSKNTVKLARKWAKRLDLRYDEYRRLMSYLRGKINIVERLMSAKEFGAIDYAKVPSKAGLKYRKAFGKRDTERYGKYLAAVKKGEKKINTSTLYPYEIVGKILSGYNDDTLEVLWNNLPNYAGDANALVMADVSGSMSGDPLNVAISLALYFAERNNGAFKNNFMTFSSSPDLVTIRGNTLRDKVFNINRANWSMSTNIQSAFDLILRTAISNRVPAKDMPAMLFIVSDMEFDSASPNRTNFNVIKSKYRVAGYEMPKLVFWNVRSRNNQTPVTEDENGTFLVSGLSAGIFKSALNTKATNPLDMMLEVLNVPRYAFLDELA